MSNPYLPNLAIIKRIVSENDVNDIKTFELAFKDPEKFKSFNYRSGQFAELSSSELESAP